MNAARASTGSKMIVFETSPARMAPVKLTDVRGRVAGNITATNTTPKTSGSTRPVTAAVLRMVYTKPMISPMRNRSVSCKSTRSIKTGSP